MHGELESLLGAGHEMVHHDNHLHDTFEEAYSWQNAAEGLTQALTVGVGLSDLLHHTHSLTDMHSHDLHSQDSQSSDNFPHQDNWHDVSDRDSQAHLHLLRHSEAHDSNGDGVSDAASRDLGIGAIGEGTHHVVSLDWHDANGHLHHSHGKDSDGDGWTDDLEQLAGTNPYDATSHPSLVEAHHFPTGTGENLPGTIDVTPSASPWLPV